MKNYFINDKYSQLRITETTKYSGSNVQKFKYGLSALEQNAESNK